MMSVKQVALVLAMASLVASYCPLEDMHKTGNCSYHIHCRGYIKGIRLPNECTESSNEPVTVALTLTAAVNILDNDKGIDNEILAFITTLKIAGNWPQTKLLLLQYTTRLENLFIINDHIENIEGLPFYYLNSLDVLDLSRNKLSQIDHLFQFELQPSKLRKLNLAYNNIQGIAGDAFDELSFLSELDLSHNAISDLTVEPFANLTSLEVLRLNNNNIINLNGAVNSLHNLKHLYLRGNHIENIDEKSLQIISHLETFDVSSNNLEEINSVVLLRHWQHFSNHAVCKIILSSNHITAVPNATAKLITTRFTRHSGRGRLSADVVTELDLSHNDISTIEYNAFQSLTRLTSLDLSNNRIIDFMIDANDVTYVRILNLSNNYILNLYFESFSLMKSLQDLDLSFNRLEYVPKQAFNKINNLKRVNVTYNAIYTLNNLHIDEFHINGGLLDLSNNGLSNLTGRLGGSSHLTSLMLHSSNITDAALVDLRYQTDLQTLDMSRNQICKLDETSLRLPVSLSYLDLSSNQIESIAPSTFVHNWHLRSLNLAHNQIKTIQYGTFRGLSSLLNLDLSFNRMHLLDSKLMMDLKSLSVLSMKHNGLIQIYDEAWFGHKYDLKVLLDDNNITCEWLADALKNRHNGYTKVRPTVEKEALSGPTLEGIPCIPKDSQKEAYREQESIVITDERLLLTSQKILEAVKEQSFYLRNYIWTSIKDDAEKAKLFS